MCHLFVYYYFFKSTPELAKLWNIGCHMWKRDFVGIYDSLKQDWSPTIKPIITALEGNIQFTFLVPDPNLNISFLHYCTLQSNAS